MKIMHVHCNHCGRELEYPYISDYVDLSMNIPCGPAITGDLCEECAEELQNIVSNFMDGAKELLDEAPEPSDED